MNAMVLPPIVGGLKIMMFLVCLCVFWEKMTGVPQLHFIITLTSHGPWIYLGPDEKQLYKQPQDIRDNYLNSMRYLDSALEKYVSQLPMGTIVILYGDHESGIPYTTSNKAPAGVECGSVFYI